MFLRLAQETLLDGGVQLGGIEKFANEVTYHAGAVRQY